MHDRPEKESDPSPVPSLGEVIAGRFVVEEVLGAGAMGVVVAARSIALKRRVAVKLMKLGAEAHERFEREAIALASIENDHVVRVLEYGTGDDGAPYLVMEFLVGRDLARELADRGPLPIDEAVDSVLEACVGLRDVHARGIVHRDLKPGNLFLVDRPGEPRRVKILDFGISKVLAKGDDEKSLTHASAIIGSPAYMSPEQVRQAKSLDARADIWSLGVVLHRLVTAKTPFIGDGYSAICAAVATDAPRRLRDDRADAPMGLERVVLRCLEKDPARRFADVAALVAALAPFASERGRAAAARFMAAAEPSGGPELEPSPPSDAPASDGAGGVTGGAAVVAPRAVAPRRWWPAALGGVALASLALLAAVPAARSHGPAEAAASGAAPIAPPATFVATSAPAVSAVAPVVDPPPASAAAPVALSAPAPRAAKGPRRATPAPPSPSPAPSTAAPPPAASASAAPSFGGNALRSRE
jgi:serine/threonine-protein kinase